MMSRHANQSHARRTAARLLLALLLAVAPVLTFAGGSPVSVTDADGSASSAIASMPCHTGAGPEADSGPQAACPHCTVDGPVSQCHCCGYAAPAGLISLCIDPTTTPAAGLSKRLYSTDPLPESPGDRLYRPPIIHG